MEGYITEIQQQRQATPTGQNSDSVRRKKIQRHREIIITRLTAL